MRITAVEISPLDLNLQTALTVAYGSYPVLNYALLKIYTDDGLLGLGEASPDPEVTGETQQTVIAALEELVGILVGADPFDIENILHTCWLKIPAFPAAMAAIDMALYDLVGKALHVPVYQILGGKSRSGIGLYPLIPLDEPQVMAALSARFVAMGADTLKVKLGSAPDLDMLRLREIHNSIGSSIKLRLDINQGWHDAPTALAVIRQLAEFNVEWIEQPVAASDLDGLAALASAVDLPIIADESCHSAADAMKIACMQAADMINIKLMKCGGLDMALVMAERARVLGLRVMLGSMSESSLGCGAMLALPG